MVEQKCSKNVVIYNRTTLVQKPRQYYVRMYVIWCNNTVKGENTSVRLSELFKRK